MKLCDLVSENHRINGSPAAKIHVTSGDMIVMTDGRRYLFTSAGGYRTAELELTEQEPYVPPHVRLYQAIKKWMGFGG